MSIVEARHLEWGNCSSVLGKFAGKAPSIDIATAVEVPGASDPPGYGRYWMLIGPDEFLRLDERELWHLGKIEDDAERRQTIFRRIEDQKKRDAEDEVERIKRDNAICQEHVNKILPPTGDKPEREETMTVGEHAKPLMASHHAAKPDEPRFGSAEWQHEQMRALHREG